jgi:hypothetical protein
MKARDFSALLSRIDSLPDSAIVPISVVAEHDNVSEKTVRRYYPLVRLTERISGVRVSYLRHRGEAPKSAA